MRLFIEAELILLEGADVVDIKGDKVVFSLLRHPRIASFMETGWPAWCGLIIRDMSLIYSFPRLSVPFERPFNYNINFMTLHTINSEEFRLVHKFIYS